MSQKFVITLTLTEDVSDREAPEVDVTTDASQVTGTHFALMSKTLRSLVIAGLEEKLRVSANLAEYAIRAVDHGAFDNEGE